MSVVLLHDCLCCATTISRKLRHVATGPFRLLLQTIYLFWGILYPFYGESAVGVISVAPALDLSATGGCSWGKLIFTKGISLKEICKDKCCPNGIKTMNSEYKYL